MSTCHSADVWCTFCDIFPFIVVYIDIILFIMLFFELFQVVYNVISILHSALYVVVFPLISFTYYINTDAYRLVT